MNQLKKLVETNDDANNDSIVGAIDNSVNIVSWNEKTWLANKKAGNIKDKVLFLGDIKGVENLIPVLDIKFDEQGVKFGWAGNQAVVFADVKSLSHREDYLEFIKKLAELPVPEMIKTPRNARIDDAVIEDNVNLIEDIESEEVSKKGLRNLIGMAKDTLSKGAAVVN